MITKGPLIAYVPKHNSWNVFLNADMDMDIDELHVFWCNQMSRIKDTAYLNQERVSFKEAYDFVMKHKTYPIMVGIDVLPRHGDYKLFLIENDAEAIQAILTYNYD